MAKLIIDVTQGSLVSAYVKAPFGEAKEALESNGYRIISSEEMARLRVQEGKNASISANGNWTREGFIYVPKAKKVCFARHSPILDNVAEAVNCHKNEREDFLTDEQVEKALAESVEIPFNQKPVPTNRFADEEITRFVFKEFAREYEEFLREAGVSKMPVCLVDEDYVQKQIRPFARQSWLGIVDLRSVLDGGCDGLGYSGSPCGFSHSISGEPIPIGLGHSGRLRGVKDSAEGTTQKSSQESYTPKQISAALKRTKLQGIESILLDALKE